MRDGADAGHIEGSRLGLEEVLRLQGDPAGLEELLVRITPELFANMLSVDKCGHIASANEDVPQGPWRPSEHDPGR